MKEFGKFNGVEVDWIIHQVFDENTVAAHTHGLDKHNMLELEVKMPFKQEQMNEFINLIASELIKRNLIISEEYYDEGTIFTCPIYFKKTEPTFKTDDFSEDVLRVVFPDPNMKFPWDEGCEELYKNQL